MNLFYRRLGEGPPIIILHGLYGMSDNWMPVAKILAEQYSVFLPDLRNHGQSPHDAEMDYEVMAGDLRSFIEKHEIELPVIIGHSMGGKVAMQYALDAEASLRALIVADIAPVKYHPRQSHINIMKAMLSVNPKDFKSYKEVEKELSFIIHDEKILQLLLKNIKRESDSILSWKLNINAIFNHQLSLYDTISGEIPFHGPALFIKAEHSDYITDDYRQNINMLFPNAKIITFNGVSHWLHAESPILFVQTVNEFLKERLF